MGYIFEKIGEAIALFCVFYFLNYVVNKIFHKKSNDNIESYTNKENKGN